MEVVLEDDATPLVMIIGTTLRRAVGNPALDRKAKRLRGVFALKSAKDPQAVTMRFRNGRVELARGVSADAQVIVTVDLDNMNGPDAPKLKLEGARRHPLFALGVGKLLEAPSRPWAEYAHEFWAFAGSGPDMPELLHVVCLDDGATLDLGAEHSPGQTYEIHGTALVLTSIFSGSSVFGQDLLGGKVFAIGSTRHASILTGRLLDWAMGITA
jgi:hypothetical protein